MGREWQRLILADYSSENPIFIDANIFLDYTLPNTEFGGFVSDFLERVSRTARYRSYHNSRGPKRGLLYSAPPKRNDYFEN